MSFDQISLIFSYYLWYMIFCISVLVTGELVFYIFRFKVSKDIGIDAFEKMIIGLIFYVSIYAIYKTTGKTILIAALIPLFFLEKRGNNLIDWKNLLLGDFRIIVFLFFAYIPVGLYFYMMSAQMEWRSSFEADALFYKNIAKYISDSGVESYLHIQNINAEHVYRVPYHYFDVWLISLFDFPGLIMTWNVVMPAMCGIAMYGIYAYARSVGAKNALAYLFTGLVFIAPLGFLHSIHFESRPVRSLKYITLFLLFLLFVIKSVKEKRVNYYLLFSMPALSVLTGPGIYGGYVLHRLTSLCYSRKLNSVKKYSKEIISLMGIGMVFVMLYSGQSPKSMNGLGLVIDQYYSVLDQRSILKIVGQIYSFSFFTLISILPYAIFLIFRKFASIKNVLFDNSELIAFTICLIFSGMVIGALLWIDPNAYQIYYLFFPLFCSFAVLIIINSVTNGRFQLLGICLVFLLIFSLAYLSHLKHSKETFYIQEPYVDQNERRFRLELREIIENEIRLNPGKVVDIFAIRDQKFFRNDIWDYYLSVYTPLPFLKFYFNNVRISQLHAHELIDRDSEVIDFSDPMHTLTHQIKRLHGSNSIEFKDALFKVRILLNISNDDFFIFAKQFTSRLKMDSIRVMYVNQRKMKYGIADRCSLFPDDLMRNVKRVVINKNSGACFIVM